MTRKRMIKLLMSVGCDRNNAARAAALADGSLSHAVLYYDLCEEFAECSASCAGSPLLRAT